MHTRVEQSSFFMIFAFISFGFMTMAFAESTTVTSTKENSIYKKVFDYAYKAGVVAGRYDKNNGYSYSPEDTLNLGPIQKVLGKLKDTAGYLYEDAAELGFNNGYIAGYKEGYY